MRLCPFLHACGVSAGEHARVRPCSLLPLCIIQARPALCSQLWPDCWCCYELVSRVLAASCPAVLVLQAALLPGQESVLWHTLFSQHLCLILQAACTLNAGQLCCPECCSGSSSEPDLHQGQQARTYYGKLQWRSRCAFVTALRGASVT